MLGGPEGGRRKNAGGWTVAVRMRKRALPMIQDLCNLSGPQFEARLEQLRTQFLPHLVAYEATESVEEFEFPGSMQQELEEVVAFEQRCCADLHWSIEPGRDGRVRFVVRGLPAGENLMSSLDPNRRG